MNQEEYVKWMVDATAALSRIYSAEDTEIVIEWFRHIRGSHEYELIGTDQVEAMLVFVTSGNCFSVYNSMMARLFIYAPIILKEAHEEMQNTLKVKYV